jgi:hypothetical protein|tara:strand:- start:501 stop:1163 length:663 start_codon:yes stop_codon:yes gene_type:complete
MGDLSFGKKQLLLDSLYKFYDDSNMKKIIPILNQESNVSLRILDWLVTNYAKKNNIMYNIENSPNSILKFVKTFNIYLNYKTQLKAYSKKQFDPFCRRERIVFKPNNNSESFVTTIGQLNFFRWALQNGVLDYANEHLIEIEKDMVSSLKNRYEYVPSKNKKRSDSFTSDSTVNIVDEKALEKIKPSTVNKVNRKKRNELSKSASKILTRIDCNIKISFS